MSQPQPIPVTAGTQVRFWRQLRWHLIFSFVLLAVLLITIVQYITLSEMDRQARRQIFSQLESVVQLKQSQITRWLTDGQVTLAYLLSGPTAGQLSTFALTARPTADEQTTINRLLSELVNARARIDTDGLRFRSFFLYAHDGRVVAASDAALVGRVVTGQPYFANSLQRALAQPPYYAVGSATLTLVMTQPLVDADGHTIAVLAAELDLTPLSAIMLDYSGLGESGETYLVSAESNYMLTPSRVAGYPLTQAYHSVGIDHALRRERGAAEYANYQIPAVPVFGVYRWIPELQAALLAEQASAEALAPAHAARDFSVALAVVAVLLACLLGLYQATRVAGPITALTKVTSAIAAGAFDQRAGPLIVRRSDEIGALARAFNQMSRELAALYASLAEQVADRTAALQAALADVQTRAEAQAQLLAEVKQQRTTIRELSVPVIPISASTLVLPLVGALDTERLRLLQEQALRATERGRARTLILDITGVPVVDSQVAQGFLTVVQTARLLGVEVLLVGIRPEVAQAIVGLGLNLPGIQTYASLQDALSRRSLNGIRNYS